MHNSFRGSSIKHIAWDCGMLICGLLICGVLMCGLPAHPIRVERWAPQHTAVSEFVLA